jgi:flagellar hook-basal body complex protein FliE
MSGLDAISSIVTGGGGATPVAVPQVPVASPFSGIFKSLVGESSDLAAKAQAAVTGVLNGSGVDVHEAMIATQKSDVAFELALQVRNKAVSAYQTMMQMQF